tara:strand:+ start:933 stop:1085 length:153 start_codon:yes stop_codon:yes gene_type:complete
MYLTEEEVSGSKYKKIKFSQLKPYADMSKVHFTRLKAKDGWDKIQYYRAV